MGEYFSQLDQRRGYQSASILIWQFMWQINNKKYSHSYPNKVTTKYSKFMYDTPFKSKVKKKYFFHVLHIFKSMKKTVIQFTHITVIIHCQTWCAEHGNEEKKTQTFSAVGPHLFRQSNLTTVKVALPGFFKSVFWINTCEKNTITKCCAHWKVLTQQTTRKLNIYYM